MWQVAASPGKKRVVLQLLLQACSGLGMGVVARSLFRAMEKVTPRH